VSQPTLSTQLGELEARLKVQLVERSRRRVVMTPLGAEIARRQSRRRTKSSFPRLSSPPRLRTFEFPSTCSSWERLQP
jgi:hypothetical protein